MKTGVSHSIPWCLKFHVKGEHSLLKEETISFILTVELKLKT